MVHDSGARIERARHSSGVGEAVRETAIHDVVTAVRAVRRAARHPSQCRCRAEGLQERVSAFQAADRSIVNRSAPPKARGGRRHHKNGATKQREIDLKTLVTHLSVEGPGRVAFSLRADPSGSAKPAEVLAAIFGDGAAPEGVRLLKEGVSFAKAGPERAHTGQPRAPRYADA